MKPPPSRPRSTRVRCAILFGTLALAGTAPVAQAPTRPQLPVLPLTELEDHALAPDLDNKTFTLTFAQPVAVRDLLLMLVRGTTLSVVPDASVSGSFIGELKNVTVRQALGLILPSLGLDYGLDGPFIRVFRREAETRLFDLNYVAVARTAAITTAGGDAEHPSQVTTSSNGDVFGDISGGVQTLLSDRGTFNVDRKAGVLQVSDFPERLDRVQAYLDVVNDRAHRQVEIDARILEVELLDNSGGPLDIAALTHANAPAASGRSRQMVSGLAPGDVARFMTALAATGTITVLGDPHIVTLNNEPALIRAVSRGGARTEDEGVTISVTPQISGEGTVMLSLSPFVSTQTVEASGKTPPVSAIRATDTLARIADGATLVLGGFTRQHDARDQQAGKGGWFGRAPVMSKKTTELIILLTPRIVASGEAQ